MIVYPNAKINLGLNILRKRIDGYHDISSVFYPLYNCFDILEIVKSKEFKFSHTGISVNDKSNLCIEAWQLLHENFGIGNVTMHLHKHIPIGAGLGGGSSDASFTLITLNLLFDLKISIQELEKYALKLGADCPFFIENVPKLVEGIGDKMKVINLDLSNYTIKLINPKIHISTKDSYTNVVSSIPKEDVIDLIKKDINNWKSVLRNDFEDFVFKNYPILKIKKEQLYSQGAIYCSMSGSGSVIYGIFKK